MKNYKYLFFYKTENLVNGKVYYGIHRTNNLNDNYLGSGILLKHAIKKYGRELFKRTILNYFDSEKELLECEKRTVDAGLIKKENTYNLTLGGKAPLSGAMKDFWDSEEGKKAKERYSKDFSGYNNPDFCKRWRPIYESVKDTFSYLTCNTNLPDKFIVIQLRKIGVNIKFHRLLNYCLEKKYIDSAGEKNKRKDYFSTNFKINSVTKTECFNKNSQFTLYKSLNEKYLNDFNEVMKIVSDKTISDSMLYNDTINIPESRQIFSKLKYYEYLNLIEKTKEIKINIRKKHPCSCRATGIKTLYKIVDNFKQDYTLIKRDINEKYKVTYDETTFQAIRI